MDSDQFAAIIAGLEDKGYSRNAIAEGSGLSRATIYRIAGGDSREPKYETVIRLKKFAERISPTRQFPK